MKIGIWIFLSIAITFIGVIFFLECNTRLTNQEEIILAIKKNDFVKLKELIKNGASLNFKAGRFYPHPIIRKLREYFPEQNKGYSEAEYINKGEAPLHCAVFQRNFEITKLLIDEGANPNYLDGFENSPLYYSNVTQIGCCLLTPKDFEDESRDYKARLINYLLLKNGAEEYICGFKQLKYVALEEETIDNVEENSNVPLENQSIMVK